MHENEQQPRCLDASIELIDAICNEFESEWRQGKSPVLEARLATADAGIREQLFEELLKCEFDLLDNAGQSINRESYLQRFPEFEAIIRAHFGRFQATLDTSRLDQDASKSELASEPAVAQELPSHVGRFAITRRLGEGTFGQVYLAHDAQLGRDVAIKVPHAKFIDRADYLELYRREAQTVCQLDKHLHIVQVYQSDSTAEHPFFVVSQYIHGKDLGKRLTDGPSFSPLEAARLIATVAETLAFAHQQRVVHRDIKPANILLNEDGIPYVADFGLALREQDLGQGPRFVGTLAYMSPEQARGEGHLVDGRSDIFSLGVIFYELLTRQRPFRGKTESEIAESIATREPRPPREIDKSIPKELERICQKCMAKRLTERYSVASDIAEDLRAFIAGSTTTSKPDAGKSEDPQIAVVPRGLRCFDDDDSDFFVSLLPAPYDRHGLPESIAFWKKLIERHCAEDTFRVGLMYGPSGCGKTSLVRAGLLPRLDDSIIPVYVEAAVEGTQQRVLEKLRRQCPSLSRELPLTDSLAALRHGSGAWADRKILLIIDQFEQWLHAHPDDEDSELVQALRQCDGGRVQCLLLVRDDFWMAITRFLRHLDIAPVPGENVAAVDLFDEKHARRVLKLFGRAYGALAPEDGVLEEDENRFIDQAVADLAEEGKVVCVRLAIFAEMIKGKPWTTATLRDVGGLEGVGVTFLEQVFSSRSANPRYRVHEKAAQSVLRALLPNIGSEIRGYQRSIAELLAASGYAGRRREFDDLLHSLDAELHLITPVDQAMLAGGSASNDQAATPQSVTADTQHFQLTHDYLVPALREWLARKQQESRCGRAEISLAERSAIWSAKPQNRHLPSIFEFPRFWLLTKRANWSRATRRMMGRAARVHSMRLLMLCLFGIAAAWLIGQVRQSGELALKISVFDQALDRSAFTDAELAEFDERIEQIAMHDTSQSDLARARLNDAFSESVAQQIRAPRLTPEEIEAIRSRIRSVGSRQPDAVARLEAQLESRMQIWETVVDLHPPFNDWQKTLPEEMFELAEQGSVLRSAEQLRDKLRSTGAEVRAREVSENLRAMITAKVRPSSGGHALLGIELANVDRSHTYQFALWVPGNAEVRRLGIQSRLFISHDGTELRNLKLTTDQLDLDSVQLTIRREGSQLVAELNGKVSIEVSDPFPVALGEEMQIRISGYHDLDLHGLSIRRKLAAARPSDLERADNMFAGGDFRTAQTAYELLRLSKNPKIATEATYKIGKCLLNLNQEREAEELLRRIVADKEHSIWKARAGSELWNLYAKNSRFREADAVWKLVSREFSLDQLTQIIRPTEASRIRGTAIVTSYGLADQHGTDVLAATRRYRELLELLHMGGSDSSIHWFRYHAASAVHQGGQLDGALTECELLLQTAFARRDSNFASQVALQAAWIHRLQGRPEKALEIIDRWARHGRHQRLSILFAERARLEVASDRLGDARKTLERLLDTVEADTIPQGETMLVECAAAATLLGYICQDLGDEDAAIQAFAGATKLYPVTADTIPNTGGRWAAAYICCFKAGELTPERARMLLEPLAHRTSNGNFNNLDGLSHSIVEIFRALAADSSDLKDDLLLRALQLPGAKDYPRRWAMKDMPRGTLHNTSCLFALEQFLRDTSAESLPESEDRNKFYSAAASRLWEMRRDGSLSDDAMHRFSLGWQGNIGDLGWQSDEAQLAEKDQLLLDILIALRIQQMGRRGDAQKLLKQTTERAEPGSLYQRIVEAARTQAN